MVCGSIGYGGVDDIKYFYQFLEEKGFSIVNHMIHENMDYSNIKDFRFKKELSNKLVNHDLKYVEMANIIVVIANNPSYGTGIEMHVAQQIGKKVILLAKNPVPTPWPINFSDYIVTNEDDLLKLLKEIKENNNYG